MTRRTTWEHRVGLNALVILVAGLSSIALTQSSADAGFFETGSVAWRSDLGSAQIEAKEKDLVLWIQFTGPWCPNCRRMERGAFVHPTVVGIARDKFVPIKLRSDEFEGLALSLGLSSLPSTVLVRPNGEVIAKHEGYADSTEFYAFLQENLIHEGRWGKNLIAKSNKPTPPGPSNIALASYCPVALVETHQLVAGQPSIVAHYQGAEYRFSTPAARAEFMKKPDRYVPVNAGASPVMQVDGGEAKAGDPRWGVIYKGRLFLCTDLYERDLFLLNPERYAHVGEAERVNVGDRRGLWALTRTPSTTSAPTYDRSMQTEPLRLQALRAPLDTLRR